MTAVNYSGAEHDALNHCEKVQGSSSAGLGTACRLGLLGLLIMLHLPMLILFGGIIVMGRLLKKKP